MAKFVIGTPIETRESGVEVTVDPQSPLPIGRHRFQLVVGDDSGNLSLPDTVEIIVRDTTNPTAVIRAPAQVESGKSFTLDGRASSDVPPGRVVKFIWTMLE
ncbi:MAG: hypothetical protein LC803_22650 [Acidobacteria bacterium]|nr:hypothetical protein [Acidobacteriota bacterium]